MSARFDLNALKVASPCPARWEDMAGDDRARFCRQCQKHVYNFSAMTTMEVEPLVLKNEGNLCGRMYRRKDGTVLTADCPTGQAVVKRKRFQWVAGLAAGVVLLASTLWAKVQADDSEDDGKFTIALKEKWYDLKVRMGWAQPPVMLGKMVMPVNHNPIGNNIPPSPPPPSPVNGQTAP